MNSIQSILGGGTAGYAPSQPTPASGTSAAGAAGGTANLARPPRMVTQNMLPSQIAANLAQPQQPQSQQYQQQYNPQQQQQSQQYQQQDNPQQQQQFMQQMQQMRQMMQMYQQQQQQQGGYGYGYGYGAPQQQYNSPTANQRMAVQQQNPQSQFMSAVPQVQSPQPMANYASSQPAAMAPQPTIANAMSTQQPAGNQGLGVGSLAGSGLATSGPSQTRPTQQSISNQPAMQTIGNQGLAMSDATQKTIEKKTLADAFLDAMKPYSYKYKDPRMEPRVVPTGGTYLGVMAQDLERIPHIGHQLVVDTPHGKMVDQKTALSATMAGLARVNERLSAVEHDLLKGKR